MRKLFIFAIFLLTFTINVKAQNIIYQIDMDIYLDEYANAQIQEVWHVKGDDGTEWYKPLRDLGNSTLSNFTVSMDGKQLQRKSWNINESLREKAGYYGINYNYPDTELCFGKYDYNEHTFTLNYNLSNFIINVDDAQVLYWTLFSKFQNVDFRIVNINIHSFYEFPDTLEVWGYGFQGYPYVSDGKVILTNIDYPSMNDSYVVALVKFPKDTFKNTNTSSNFKTFDDVYNAANEGTYQYDYNDYDSNNYNSSTSFFDKIFDYFELIFFGIFALGFGKTVKTIIDSSYGYKDNKEIKPKETPFFRDIPCNKDIYYANALVYLNNFNYKEANILGAIILKWVKQEKVKFIKQESGILKKEVSSIDLRLSPTFDNPNEKRLFDVMYNASGDGILEKKKKKKWAKRNYSKFFDIFKDLKDDKVNELKQAGHIYKRQDKAECKKKNVMDDTIYYESKKLLGLKKFLQEFSNINTRETIEVHIWDEYLMFAYIFGIADKVAKQLKNLYPQLLEQQNFDYDTIMIINNISTSTVHAASAARSAAESYSSGGGGFSSGGGGGGSFGGGGFSGGGSR